MLLGGQIPLHFLASLGGDFPKLWKLTRSWLQACRFTARLSALE